MQINVQWGNKSILNQYLYVFEELKLKCFGSLRTIRRLKLRNQILIS